MTLSTGEAPMSPIDGEYSLEADISPPPSPPFPLSLPSPPPSPPLCPPRPHPNTSNDEDDVIMIVSDSEPLTVCPATYAASLTQETSVAVLGAALTTADAPASTFEEPVSPACLQLLLCPLRSPITAAATTLCLVVSTLPVLLVLVGPPVSQKNRASSPCNPATTFLLPLLRQHLTPSPQQLVVHCRLSVLPLLHFPGVPGNS